jgi:hypothetical protein
MSKTDNGVVDYFFFFFFTFFFFAFALCFFAIAALLALSGWRHRYSAVANRPALPSDYYSRKKLTVTLLNFVCKWRAPRAAAIAARTPVKYATEKFRHGVNAREEFSVTQKFRWNAAFYPLAQRAVVA